MKYLSQIYDILPTKLSLRPTLSNPIQAFSSHFDYVISGNVLFSYSSTTASYTSLQSLASYQLYNLVSRGNQLIIWGSSSSIQSGKYDLNQTIYAIVDQGGVTKTILSNAIYAVNNPLPTVPVHISPSMSKIHY